MRRGLSCDLPNINLLLANELQKVVIYSNLKQLLHSAKGILPENTKLLRLIIQGAGGVGKSFIIKALTRVTRRIYKQNKSVMNLAPTGAACNLLQLMVGLCTVLRHHLEQKKMHQQSRCQTLFLTRNCAI